MDLNIKLLSQQLTDEQFQELLQIRNQPNFPEQDEVSCPYCGSVSIQKYGKTANKTQRYRCKDCAKIFSHKSNTVQHYSKNPLRSGLVTWN